MDPPSEEGSSGDGQYSEKELDTRIVQIQAKRFYVDVKENRRGRFIKLAEVSTGHRKNRIIVPMSIVAEFRDRLTEFDARNNQIGPASPSPLPEDGKLHSRVIIKDFRRYYLDLKENERGRFVRVSLISRGIRSQLGIPAQGLIRLRDAFTELIDLFAIPAEIEEERVAFRGDLPESRSIRVENKTFFFDIGQNDRGVFMKISEVKQNFRSSITIPDRSWGKFRDTIDDYMRGIRSNPDPPLEGGRDRDRPAGSSQGPGPSNFPGPSSGTSAFFSPPNLGGL
ncbi:hypothetical protein RvY_17787 [Ramazzottius varieornatus]|uniref:Transcriptional activator protein Pur-alpha n=1 Tax=Ramazzottius varieornatus TaxID=947166 RepID=A0A1D1WA17_RAMVA|nr:hypothetical protein RvY_17787 [Ramazzottius varieornatus]